MSRSLVHQLRGSFVMTIYHLHLNFLFRQNKPSSISKCLDMTLCVYYFCFYLFRFSIQPLRVCLIETKVYNGNFLDNDLLLYRSVRVVWRRSVLYIIDFNYYSYSPPLDETVTDSYFLTPCSRVTGSLFHSTKSSHEVFSNETEPSSMTHGGVGSGWQQFYSWPLC